MSEIDVTTEWQRLTAQYAEMDDEELQAIANDGYELTDIAKQALQSELSRRRVDVKLRETPAAQDEDPPDPGSPTFDPADLHLVVAASVWDVEQARRLKLALDEASVPAYLGPENSEDFSRLPQVPPSGVELRVRDIDLQRAYAAMSQSANSEKEDDTPDPEYAGHCPKCHSSEIVFEALEEGPTDDGSAPTEKFNWSCDACGHQWKDDGIESET